MPGLQSNVCCCGAEVSGPEPPGGSGLESSGPRSSHARPTPDNGVVDPLLWALIPFVQGLEIPRRSCPPCVPYAGNNRNSMISSNSRSNLGVLPTHVSDSVDQIWPTWGIFESMLASFGTSLTNDVQMSSSLAGMRASVWNLLRDCSWEQFWSHYAALVQRPACQRECVQASFDYLVAASDTVPKVLVGECAPRVLVGKNAKPMWLSKRQEMYDFPKVQSCPQVQGKRCFA